MNKHSLEAILDLATSLGRWHGKISYPVLPYRASQVVSKLQRLARSLHKRYEAECSYQWADNDVYRKRTASLEKKAHELAVSLGVELELQKDPRGWPLIIKFPEYEGRLG